LIVCKVGIGEAKDLMRQQADMRFHH